MVCSNFQGIFYFDDTYLDTIFCPLSFQSKEYFPRFFTLLLFSVYLLNNYQ